MAIDLGLTTAGWIIFFVLVFIFLIGATVVTIILFSRRYWNYRVLVLENQTGLGARPKARDKARLVGIGDGGEEVFYLRRHKKYKIGYGKYIGQNYICWTIGKDGYWYNTVFGDVDKSLGEVGVFPVAIDQRYATSAVRDLVKSNYASKSFMEKYGAVLYFGLFAFTMLIFAGVVWYTFDKLADSTANNIEAQKISQTVMETAKQVLSSLENICQGGSGFVDSGGT